MRGRHVSDSEHLETQHKLNTRKTATQTLHQTGKLDLKKFKTMLTWCFGGASMWFVYQPSSDSMDPTQLRVLSLHSGFVYCVKTKSDKRVKWPSFPRITIAFHVVLIAAANRPPSPHNSPPCFLSLL